MTYKGIVRGNTIELEEHFPFPEGEHVEVEISASIPPRKGSPQAILKLAGTLTDAEADFIRQAVSDVRRIEDKFWQEPNK